MTKKKHERLSAFSNTGLITFAQPVKMIKGLLSVFLVLVVVTSTTGKPEKSHDKVAVKKEKRVPQTLSRGEYMDVFSFPPFVYSYLHPSFSIASFHDAHITWTQIARKLCASLWLLAVSSSQDGVINWSGLRPTRRHSSWHAHSKKGLISSI